MKHSIYWKAKFNYLFHSKSWNEWYFEITNHSNRSNGQVLLSFNFSCYNVSRSYYQLLLMEHYVAGNLQSTWNEWRALSSSTFISLPWVRKCQIKLLNSLDRWPTVVLILSMLCITMATVNLLVDQGHSLQLGTISLIAMKDGSLHSVSYIGEISVLSMALT